MIYLKGEKKKKKTKFSFHTLLQVYFFLIHDQLHQIPGLQSVDGQDFFGYKLPFQDIMPMALLEFMCMSREIDIPV